MRGAGRGGCVLIAHDELFAAGRVVAVLDALGCRAALVALADRFRVCREVDGHALVEDVERTVPQAGVAVLFAVANDAAVELVDLAESAAAHKRGEHFAADAARAVGDDGNVLEVVVLAAVEFGDEVTSGVDIRNNRIGELADRSLDGVAAVKEGHVFAGHEFMQLFGAQLCAAADHTVFVNLKLTGSAEADDLVAHLHAELREVVALAFAPLEVDVLERRILARFAHIPLNVFELAADGAIHAVFGEDDATAEPEELAEVALPQPHSLRIGQRREHVEEKDLRNSHRASLRLLAGGGSLVHGVGGGAGVAVPERTLFFAIHKHRRVLLTQVFGVYEFSGKHLSIREFCFRKSF